MEEIISFCDRLQFINSWGTDICKLIIIYFLFKFIMFLGKMVTGLCRI